MKVKPMKCPYQTIVIHEPQHTGMYATQYAKDITKFAECIKDECPFYDCGTCSRVKAEMSTR